DCRGKVIFTGMGKPGHIGAKLAATFASLGTPAFFMHPAEAMHGDLGMVEEKDVVILTSYSGESEEVTRLLPVLQEIGCVTVAITGKPKSTLAKACQYHFFFPAFEEACFMHLAPTSSTTALLVLGDAMAVVASRAKHYTKEDFGLHHPAGALGKQLLVKVQDVMHTDRDNAVVRRGSSLRSAIVEMSSKGLSMVTIVDEENRLAGIITDGDLRRMLERGVDVYNEIVDNVMTANPKWIDYREMAVNALQFMSDRKITCMPVLDENRQVVGSVLMQDIFKAGIVR
ncbi:MAG: KpsF/GutQ family sugar-phosphate isomerase, partial [Candidatus Ventricola sp.]|nr:KpsF/GutQ family sugar-phosphate isomerase [Candidatus Ventricola sp.]